MKTVSVKKLFVLFFLYSLAANFAHPVTPTFIKELGLHDYMFGLAFAMMSLGNFLFSPFWGKMSEKFGPGKIFAFGHLGYGVMQLFFGISNYEWQICVARFVGGFFISAISVSQLIYVMKYSNQSGKDLAVAATINMVTAPFGFLIGGFIGDVTLRGTFYLQGVSLFAVGLLSFATLADEKILDQSKLSFDQINPFASFAGAKNYVTPLILLFLSINVFAAFAGTSYEQCFNYFIKDQYGFPASYNGILKAGVGFIALAANSTITMRLLKTNTFKTVIPVFAILFAMLVGVIVIDQMVPFIILNVVFFGCNSVVLPLLQNMLTKYKVTNRSELVGLFNAVRSLGMVFGSLFAGFIYDLGPKLSFVFAALAFALCVAIRAVHYSRSKAELL